MTAVTYSNRCGYTGQLTQFNLLDAIRWEVGTTSTYTYNDTDVTITRTDNGVNVTSVNTSILITNVNDKIDVKIFS